MTDYIGKHRDTSGAGQCRCDIRDKAAERAEHNRTPQRVGKHRPEQVTA